MNAVSIQNKDFTIVYKYKYGIESLRLLPLLQNFKEIVINNPNWETVIEFTAYVSSTKEPVAVNGNSTFIFRSRSYRKKAFIIVGERRE